MSSTLRIEPAGHTEHVVSFVLNEGREDAAALIWPANGIFEIGTDDTLTVRVRPRADVPKETEPSVRYPGPDPAEPATTDAADPAPSTTDAAKD